MSIMFALFLALSCHMALSHSYPKQLKAPSLKLIQCTLTSTGEHAAS